MVSDIIQFWLDQRAADGETGVVIGLPIKSICMWDEYCSPTGSWVLKNEVRQWANEHQARIVHSRDQAEKNVFVRFHPSQTSLATLFKLTFA